VVLLLLTPTAPLVGSPLVPMQAPQPRSLSPPPRLELPGLAPMQRGRRRFQLVLHCWHPALPSGQL
jgi:hypothetical protein